MTKTIRLRWADHIARKKEGWSAFKILIGKPTGKRLLRRPMHSYGGNFTMDLKEIDVNTRN